MDSSLHSASSKAAKAPSFILSLDELAKLSYRELSDLYAAGTVPDSLAALDGDLVGRMLAVRGLDPHLMRGMPFRTLTRFARSHGFPWGGKSFRAKDALRGTGINRLDLAKAGRHRVFPFATRFGASVVDARPCVILDYDHPDNPAIIRAIHDEVREVAPRLFLGPACAKRAHAEPVLVLWFALDARPAHHDARDARAS